MAEDRTGVAARLDALEAAHKAGTADGPWRSIDRGRADPECRYEILDDEGSVAVCSDDNDATASTGADRVALIVAAVNDLPTLLAAVRGVLALADEWQASGEQHHGYAENARGRFDLASELVHGLTAADLIEHAERLRATVAAALGEA